ncbi:MAG: SDR family NAD(P)-dependent oxidoreductase, partial [Planctomycetota bacterium]
MNDEARELAGRAALVTGASSGIGQAVARKLASMGAPVAVTARRADVLDTLVDEIHAAGGRALAVAGDVRDEEHAAGAVLRT